MTSTDSEITHESLLPSSSSRSQSSSASHPYTLSTLPHNSIGLSVLKTVESELRRRGTLHTANDSIPPLWFIAETERNVFLWRTGQGLAEQFKFDFWIDTEKLITKRLRQLENPERGNPFVSPIWSTSPTKSDSVKRNEPQREKEYLEDLTDLMAVFIPHAAALSRASREVRDELEPESAIRPIIVLPAASSSVAA